MHITWVFSSLSVSCNLVMFCGVLMKKKKSLVGDSHLMPYNAIDGCTVMGIRWLLSPIQLSIWVVDLTYNGMGMVIILWHHPSHTVQLWCAAPERE